jgi:hypothetical protein
MQINNSHKIFFPDDKTEKKIIILIDCFLNSAELLSKFSEVPHFFIDKSGEAFHVVDIDTPLYVNGVPFEGCKNAIFIALSNRGGVYENGEGYCDFFGKEIPKNEVFDKDWRGHRFWDSYTDSQIKTLKNILSLFIKEDESLLGGEGSKVFSRSDFNDLSFDINPSLYLKMDKHVFID